jgi:ribonuclease HI
MSDATKQDTLFEVTGKKVTVWTNATGKTQYNHDATDGYGCVIKDEGSGRREEIQGKIEYEDHYTAPVAKYKAIINGIGWVCNEYSGVGVIQVYNDTETPVEQIDGNHDVGCQHLQRLKEEAQRLLSEFDEWHIDWRGETQSREIRRADELAKDATRGGK